MNPTDGIQPTTATGGLDNALSQPDSPAGTTATPDAPTSWEQPPRRKRRVRRSPQMMALLDLLKRYRGTISFVALALAAPVAAGVLWGPKASAATVLIAALLGIVIKSIYDEWWIGGYPSGRKQWEALVQKQRDKLKNQEGLR